MLRLQSGVACVPLAVAMLLIAPAPASAQVRGQAAFSQNCAACHQEDGKGVPDAFPALAGNAFVQGPPELVAGVVLHGKGDMPALGTDLVDDTIADILTFIRSAWGNTASSVTKETVAKVRAAGK